MLLFFRVIMILILIFLILLLTMIFSKLQIDIKNIKIIGLERRYEIEYNIIGTFYLLGILKIFSIRIKSDDINSIIKTKSIKDKIAKINEYKNDSLKTRKVIDKSIIEKLWNDIEIKTFNLKIDIDTESPILTSYLVGIISTIVPNLIRNKIQSFNRQKYSFEILPIYRNQNNLYLEFNSIISIKLVHIINMLKMIGGIKNERTSNRRLDAYCNGKYKKYDRC